MLDPQVQICIINLAEKWVEQTQIGIAGETQEQVLDIKASAFDKAYKAIAETIEAQAR